MRRLTAGLESEAEAAAEPAPQPVVTRLCPMEHWRPGEDGLLAAIPAAMPAPEPSRTLSPQPMEPPAQVAAPPQPARGPAPQQRVRRPHTGADRVLLAIEVLALVGLVYTVALSLGSVRRLERNLLALAGVDPTAVQTANPVAWAQGSATPRPSATATVPTATQSLALRPTGTATSRALAPTEVILPPGRISPTATMAGNGMPAPEPTATPGPTPLSPTGVRFVIPAIGVDAPMVEGDDWETLKGGIGHHPGSAWPGELGNTVVAAHNDVYGAIFKDLTALKPGDLVVAYTPQGTFQYQVLFTRLVLPTDVSVIAPTRQAILTMITCYPPFVDTHRLVVTAKLVEQESIR